MSSLEGRAAARLGPKAYRHPSGNPFQLGGLEPHPLGDPQWGASFGEGQRPVGQDVVARDKVELHGSCVVLEGQQALPHDGVLLLSGRQTDVISSRLQSRAMLDMAPGNSLLV